MLRVLLADIHVLQHRLNRRIRSLLVRVCRRSRHRFQVRDRLHLLEGGVACVLGRLQRVLVRSVFLRVGALARVYNRLNVGGSRFEDSLLVNPMGLRCS